MLGSSSLNLRALGEPEPSAAPMHRPPPPPRPAVPVSEPPPGGETDGSDRWLIKFGFAAVILGIIAVVIFNLIR